MATKPVTARLTAPSLSSNLMRELSLRWLNHTIAAMAGISMMCVVSCAVGATKEGVERNAFSLPAATMSAGSQDPDYTQDYVPGEQSVGGPAEITNGRLVLYYEIPTLFIALVIGFGSLMCRGRTRGEVDLSNCTRSAAEDRRRRISQIRS